MSDHEPMLPELAMKAVRATFGSDPSEVRPLTAGMSTAQVYRIVVGGRPYVVRIVTNPQREPTAHFAAMRAAAELGIAPRVHYASVTDRLAITDFIEAKPFPSDLTVPLTSQLAKLHAMPLWDKRVDMFAMIDGMVSRGCVLDCAELFDRYREVRKVVGSDDDLAPCHNDLKWENVIWDGTTLWFVDWEAVFVNNRYFDLAVAGNFFMREEDHYLAAYLGTEPTEHQRSRALLVRVIAHVSYLTMFAMLSGLKDDGSPAPAFRAFHDDLLTGREDPRDATTKLRYAKAHLGEALRLVRSPAFFRALSASAR